MACIHLFVGCCIIRFLYLAISNLNRIWLQVQSLESTWSTNQIKAKIHKWSQKFITAKLRRIDISFNRQDWQWWWRWNPSCWFQWLFGGFSPEIIFQWQHDGPSSMEPGLNRLARLSPDSCDSQHWWSRSVSVKSTSTYLFSIICLLYHIGLKNKPNRLLLCENIKSRNYNAALISSSVGQLSGLLHEDSKL